MNRQRLVRLRNRDGQVARTIRRPRCIRRLTELTLPFGLLRRRRLQRQRVRPLLPDFHIFPLTRQRLVRLRNRAGQVARAIRRPPCIRGHTELPLPFCFSFRATRSEERRVGKVRHSRIVPVNHKRLVRLRNRVGQVARKIRRPPCIRGLTELPLPFGLLRRRRLPRQRFRFSRSSRHTISTRDWSSDVCSTDLGQVARAIRRPPCIRGHTELPLPFCFSFRAT